jgi:hypothetical protein
MSDVLIDWAEQSVGVLELERAADQLRRAGLPNLANAVEAWSEWQSAAEALQVDIQNERAERDALRHEIGILRGRLALAEA